jgi:hypothetical protein
MGFILHPAIPYVVTVVAGAVVLGFGVTNIRYPRSAYSRLRLSFVPSTSTEWADIEYIMFLSGAKDVFIGAIIFASMWFGTECTYAIISMGYGTNAILDAWLLKAVRTDGWFQWGYGTSWYWLGQ